jgi:putative membrane protein
VIAMMFWYGHDMSGWGWFGATLSMIAFWALIIAALVLLFRSLSRPTAGSSQNVASRTPPSAEELLAERFARGEIDEEEYERRLRVLRSTGTDLTKH